MTHIIIRDIDQIIVGFLSDDLPTLVTLLSVNKYFQQTVSTIKLVDQWLKVNTMHIYTPYGIFLRICQLGYLEYAIYMLNKHQIDIHSLDEYAFILCCSSGHLELAKYLIMIAETTRTYYSPDKARIDNCEIQVCYRGINKINISANYDSAFKISCANGHTDIVKWLVELGESGTYGKVDIHTTSEYAFKMSCANGHTDIAKWLVELGESGTYGKVDIHAASEYAFRHSCANGHIDIAKWLVKTGEADMYGMIDIHINNDDAFKKSCKNGHWELARWLIELGQTDMYTEINIDIINSHMNCVVAGVVAGV